MEYSRLRNDDRQQSLARRSCVVAGTALRRVDWEIVGRNDSERKHSPEIDRDRSGRPYRSEGKAESWDAL